jgi:hypothetical protein
LLETLILFIFIDDAIEVAMIAWRKTDIDYEVYSIDNEDWIRIRSRRRDNKDHEIKRR